MAVIPLRPGAEASLTSACAGEAGATGAAASSVRSSVVIVSPPDERSVRGRTRRGDVGDVQERVLVRPADGVVLGGLVGARIGIVGPFGIGRVGRLGEAKRRRRAVDAHRLDLHVGTALRVPRLEPLEVEAQARQALGRAGGEVDMVARQEAVSRRDVHRVGGGVHARVAAVSDLGIQHIARGRESPRAGRAPSIGPQTGLGA